jgi:hypothetical protein
MQTETTEYDMSDFTVEIPLDIAVILLRVIKACSKRGAFRAAELSDVGAAYDALDAAVEDEIEAIQDGDYDDEDEEVESNVIQFPNGSKAVEGSDWCNCPMCQENAGDSKEVEEVQPEPVQVPDVLGGGSYRPGRSRLQVIPIGPGGIPELLKFLELTKLTGGVFGPPRLSGGE